MQLNTYPLSHIYMEDVMNFNLMPLEWYIGVVQIGETSTISYY